MPDRVGGAKIFFCRSSRKYGGKGFFQGGLWVTPDEREIEDLEERGVCQQGILFLVFDIVFSEEEADRDNADRGFYFGEYRLHIGEHGPRGTVRPDGFRWGFNIANHAVDAIGIAVKAVIA